MEFEIADPRDLQPHPDYKRLFLPAEAAELDELLTDMDQGGRFQPLLITQDGHILAGVEQWQVAMRLGWDSISVLRTGPMRRSELVAVMVAENIRSREIREEHLWRGMNNFFDMQPLRPPGGW